jgi:flagellar biosynthesis activator protein FlaF
MRNAAQIYGKVAKETASPRELEANLLLRAAARFQSVKDSGAENDKEFDDALMFNRKLWSIFLTSVTQPDNPLPASIRQNIANLGLFVMSHTVVLSAEKRRDGLTSLISINRELAAGLLGRA